jgi:DNA-binding CsgD family transcriptional regulator
MLRRRPPDDLTAREREVLHLIRLGLTNEEIALRLDISLAGAKYHVSQILSKLGVASREEAVAAAVALGERQRWWARWPVWARIAGAATVAATAAGLAVLSWGVVRTKGGDAEISRLTESPTADGTPGLQSGMAHYASEEFGVEFDYLGTWVPDPDDYANTSAIAEGYRDPRGREFGFFVVDACCKDGLTLDDAAELFAGSIARPPGEEPHIESLALLDGEARLILPDERSGDLDRAQLIIRYSPLPRAIGTVQYAMLILYAHRDYIRAIAETLHLTE